MYQFKDLVQKQEVDLQIPPVDPPTSVTFSSPGNYAAGIALLGSLDTTDYRGIWVKYVVDASASAVLDCLHIRNTRGQ